MLHGHGVWNGLRLYLRGRKPVGEGQATSFPVLSESPVLPESSAKRKEREKKSSTREGERKRDTYGKFLDEAKTESAPFPVARDGGEETVLFFFVFFLISRPEHLRTACWVIRIRKYTRVQTARAAQSTTVHLEFNRKRQQQKKTKKKNMQHLCIYSCRC